MTEAQAGWHERAGISAWIVLLILVASGVAPREYIVVQSIAEGNNNKEITSDVGIKTVLSQHVAAMKKIVNSTAGLVTRSEQADRA